MAAFLDNFFIFESPATDVAVAYCDNVRPLCFLAERLAEQFLSFKYTAFLFRRHTTVLFSGEAPLLSRLNGMADPINRRSVHPNV
jgi:hypothetical protein